MSFKLSRTHGSSMIQSWSSVGQVLLLRHLSTAGDFSEPNVGMSLCPRPGDCCSEADFRCGAHVHCCKHLRIFRASSEEAFMWVLTAPFFLFKDSVLFSTESDNLIKNPTIIR
jgi:hypothetical protein